MAARKGKARIDIDDIARRMGAEVKGEVAASAGYFGALQLAARVESRFKTPRYGGRASDPTMTELRNIRLNPETLRLLERLAAEVSKLGPRVAPLQVAAMLLEAATEQVTKSAPAPRHLKEAGEEYVTLASSSIRSLLASTTIFDEAERRAVESVCIEAESRPLLDVAVGYGESVAPRAPMANL